MKIGIAGIHTGIGKTVCSAVLCEALGYDYFKPVQAGDLDHTDSDFIRRTVSNECTLVHAENYQLSTAASPHYAAQVDGLSISKKNLRLPATENGLIVETAGGVMTPLSDRLVNTDLLLHFHLPVILVSAHYLGSINHTLCTIEVLKAKNIDIIGIVFSGRASESSESYILKHSKLKHLFSIPPLGEPDREKIKNYARANAEKIKEAVFNYAK